MLVACELLQGRGILLQRTFFATIDDGCLSRAFLRTEGRCLVGGEVVLSVESL